MPEDFMSSLARIEKSIRAADGDAILARWNFGRAVLGQRVGQQLPKGLQAEILAAVGISQPELSNRTRVAWHYDRKVISQLITSGETWTALVKGLPKVNKATSKPKPPDAPPTKADRIEAERVQKALAKPAVRTVLLEADAEAKQAKAAKAAAKRAQAEADRAEREAAQEAQHQADVMRQRLVKRHADWRQLTAQFEIMADTVKRILALIEGLPVPEQLQMRAFDTQLGSLQNALHEVRGRLHGTAASAGAVDRPGVIEVTAW